MSFENMTSADGNSTEEQLNPASLETTDQTARAAALDRSIAAYNRGFDAFNQQYQHRCNLIQWTLVQVFVVYTAIGFWASRLSSDAESKPIWIGLLLGTVIIFFCAATFGLMQFKHARHALKMAGQCLTRVFDLSKVELPKAYPAPRKEYHRVYYAQLIAGVTITVGLLLFELHRSGIAPVLWRLL